MTKPNETTERWTSGLAKEVSRGWGIQTQEDRNRQADAVERMMMAMRELHDATVELDSFVHKAMEPSESSAPVVRSINRLTKAKAEHLAALEAAEIWKE
jgi:hypothetical protein